VQSDRGTIRSDRRHAKRSPRRVESPNGVRRRHDRFAAQLSEGLLKSGNTIARSIRKAETVFHAGGAGGGGFYEVRVGPGRDAPEHLTYVMEGTGLYGSLGTVIRARMSGGHRGVLAIQKRGEGVRFRTFARGQRPQRQWYDDAVQVADQFVEEGLRSIRLDRP
jgi:hypothetical protein